MGAKGKQLRGVLTLATSVCLLILCVISVYAADGHSLTLEYGQDGTAFYIYHVGNYDGSGYELAEGYEDSNVSIPSEDGWGATAASLAEYTEENALEAKQDGLTTPTGQVRGVLNA